MQAVQGLPDTAVAHAAIQLARSTESPAVFNHSVRSYLFGELLAEHDGIRPGTDYDPEVLFLACVLHDLGVGTAAPGNARFEVEGADLAAALLTEHGRDRATVDAVWDAIALHTSFGIVERRGGLCYLVNGGVGMDFGINAEIVDDQTAAAIHGRHPRLSMVASLMDAIAAQAERSPEAAPPYSFPSTLLRERHADGISLLERIAPLSRWGE
jgi:hypothetical protein